MEDIIKIVKSLEDSGLLLKGVSETVQNEAKKRKGGFLRMLLSTLGASLLGKMLVRKWIIRTGYRSKDLQSKGRKGIIRPGYDSRKRIFNTASPFN